MSIVAAMLRGHYSLIDCNCFTEDRIVSLKPSLLLILEHTYLSLDALARQSVVFDLL